MDAETVEVKEYVYKKNKEGRKVVDPIKTEKNTHRETLFFNGHSTMSFFVQDKE